LTNYVVLAIPVFFLVIGIELVAARLLERDSYRLNDSIADLSCGILQQLFEVFAKSLIWFHRSRPRRRSPSMASPGRSRPGTPSGPTSMSDPLRGTGLFFGNR